MDDSGIPQIKEALTEVLTENHQLQQMLDQLERTKAAVRDRLRQFFYERRSIMEREFDPKDVETSIAKIENRLVAKLDSFGGAIEGLTKAHRNDQEALGELMEARIATMVLLAKDVLSDYEKNDVSRHWQSRRYGY